MFLYSTSYSRSIGRLSHWTLLWKTLTSFNLPMRELLQIFLDCLQRPFDMHSTKQLYSIFSTRLRKWTVLLSNHSDIHLDKRSRESGTTVRWRLLSSHSTWWANGHHPPHSLTTLNEFEWIAIKSRRRWRFSSVYLTCRLFPSSVAPNHLVPSLFTFHFHFYLRTNPNENPDVFQYHWYESSRNGL